MISVYRALPRIEGRILFAAALGLLFLMASVGLSTGPAPVPAQTGKEAAKKAEKKSTPTGKKEAEKEEAKTGEDETGEAKEEGGEKEKGKTETAKALTPDEQFVRENLEKYLSPTKIEFLEDGRTALAFDFGDKKSEHMTIFTPPISGDKAAKFRYSLRGEFGGWGGGAWSSGAGGGENDAYWEGIRISNEGMAHLNIWFTDDIEAEMYYIQSVTSRPEQIVAVLFTNASGNSLGSKFGSQCTTFARGKVQKVKGEPELVKNEVGTKMKLVVKGGKFEAYRDNKRRSSMEYSQKSYASGKVGMLWAGGVASFIHRMEITGKIDAKKMAQEMKKGKGKGK